MTGSSTQARRPRGLPSGGQFSAVARAETGPTLIDDAESAARLAFETLLKVHPARALALWEGWQAPLAKAEYPEMGVRDTGDGGRCFTDPYTGQDTTVTVDDIAIRRCRSFPIDVEDDVVTFDYDEDSHPENFVLRSGSTGLPVCLPDGWTVE